MTDPDPRWTIVWQHAERRRLAMGMTKEALYAACGISEGTYRKMAVGTPLTRPDKRVVFCRGLMWADDSIERILDGREPVPMFGNAEDAEVMRRSFVEDVLTGWEAAMTADGGPDLALGGSSVETELLKMAIRRLRLDAGTQVSRLDELEARSLAQAKTIRSLMRRMQDAEARLAQPSDATRRPTASAESRP